MPADVSVSVMVQLRSGSTTTDMSTSDMANQLTPDNFALCLIEALKDDQVIQSLKKITQPNAETLKSIVSADLQLFLINSNRINFCRLSKPL